MAPPARTAAARGARRRVRERLSGAHPRVAGRDVSRRRARRRRTRLRRPRPSLRRRGAASLVQPQRRGRRIAAGFLERRRARDGLAVPARPRRARVARRRAPSTRATRSRSTPRRSWAGRSTQWESARAALPARRWRWCAPSGRSSTSGTIARRRSKRSTSICADGRSKLLVFRSGFSVQCHELTADAADILAALLDGQPLGGSERDGRRRRHGRLRPLRHLDAIRPHRRRRAILDSGGTNRSSVRHAPNGQEETRRLAQPEPLFEASDFTGYLSEKSALIAPGDVESAVARREPS